MSIQSLRRARLSLCPNQQQTNKSATGARKSIARRSFECLRFVCARETCTHHNVLGARRPCVCASVCHSIQLCFIFNIVFAFVVSARRVCADVVCNFHYDLCCSLFDSTITSIEIDQIKSCMCPIPFHSSIPMCAQHARLANVPLVAGSSRRSIDQSSMQLSFSFSNRIAKRNEAICALLLWVARIAAVGGNKYACLFGVSGRWNLEEEFSYGKNRSMAHNLITDKHKTISNWQRALPLLEYFILWQTRALSLSRPLSRDVRCDALER